MDASAIIGNGQAAYAAGLQKQVAASADALQGTKGPSMGKAGASAKKTKEAAQQFEGFFVGQMMENMTAGMEPDAIFGGGTGEEMWRSMLNQEYGKQVAKSGKLGIANHVMKAMLQAQEQRTAAQTGQAAVIQTAAKATKALNAASDATASGLNLNTPAGVLASARFIPVKR